MTRVNCKRARNKLHSSKDFTLLETPKLSQMSRFAPFYDFVKEVALLLKTVSRLVAFSLSFRPVNSVLVGVLEKRRVSRASRDHEGHPFTRLNIVRVIIRAEQTNICMMNLAMIIGVWWSSRERRVTFFALQTILLNFRSWWDVTRLCRFVRCRDKFEFILFVQSFFFLYTSRVSVVCVFLSSRVIIESIV